MQTTTKTVFRSETGKGNRRLAIDLSPDEKIALTPSKAIRTPRVAKHQPRLTDGLVHPVTVRRIAG